MARFSDPVCKAVACTVDEEVFFFNFTTDEGNVPISMRQHMVKKFETSLLAMLELGFFYPDFKSTIKLSKRKLTTVRTEYYPCTAIRAGRSMHPDTDNEIYTLYFDCVYEDVYFIVDQNWCRTLLKTLTRSKLEKA